MKFTWACQKTLCSC